MKQFIDIKDYGKAIENFKGAYAQIWTFHVSLKRLVIRLSLTGQKEVLYILIAGCEYIQGPFSWEQSDIILEDVLKDNIRDYTVRFFDRNSLFELRASGGMVLFYGNSDDLWWTIDDLKIDDNIAGEDIAER